jgi:hypothetical protein
MTKDNANVEVPALLHIVNRLDSALDKLAPLTWAVKVKVNSIKQMEEEKIEAGEANSCNIAPTSFFNHVSLLLDRLDECNNRLQEATDSLSSLI